MKSLMMMNADVGDGGEVEHFTVMDHNDQGQNGGSCRNLDSNKFAWTLRHCDDNQVCDAL